VITTSPRSAPSDSHKKTSSVASYFRDTRFTGKKEQSIRRAIRDYNVCARQYELSAEQKKIFFVNVFGGSARDFFFDNCGDNMDFESLESVMVKEFDSDARQLAVHSELDRITLERVMAEAEITDTDSGLTALVEKINILTPQCPPNFRSEDNKTRFLRNAFLRHGWAEPAISQITTARFTYNAFVTALREQLQLSEEKKALLSTSKTFFQRYGRNPGLVRRFPSNASGTRQSRQNSGMSMKNPIGKDGRRMLCRLCQADDHFANRSTADKFRANVQDKLRQGLSAVHLLSEIASQLDVEDNLDENVLSNGDDEKLEPESELDTFNNLVEQGDVKESSSSVDVSFSQAIE